MTAAAKNPHPQTAHRQNPQQTQLLHLVFGGELVDLKKITFKDLHTLDIVGIYPDYASAYVAWKAKAQATVDNAHMRYFIVHLHRLLDPERQTADLISCGSVLPARRHSGGPPVPFWPAICVWSPAPRARCGSRSTSTTGSAPICRSS